MTKRGIRAAAGLLAAVLLAGTAAAAPPLSAEKAVLLDAASGRVLYEKNGGARSLIASTTKIMTALLVCERGNLDEEVRVPKEAVGVEGSSLYLREGETLTVRDLLYGLMLHSGNDAAVALAIVCGGSEADFVEQMNEKARSLGLADTHYANPNGLDDDGNYATALDLANLAAAALQNEDFRAVVSCKSATAGGRVLHNHNKLLRQYDGAIGVKTGYTKAAGRILVSAAERDGRMLVAVTIRDSDDWRDHAALLDYGFSCFQRVLLLRAGDRAGTVPVTGGVAGTVGVAAAEDFWYPMTGQETADVRLRLPPFVYAPVTAGEEAGKAEILIGDTVVGTVPLYYQEDVAQAAPKRSLFERLLGGTS